MEVLLEIPDDLARSLADSPGTLRRRICLDLAVYYYAENLVSLGKAVELAGVTRGEFEEVLSARRIDRNYSADDLTADLAWAKRAQSL